MYLAFLKVGSILSFMESCRSRRMSVMSGLGGVEVYWQSYKKTFNTSKYYKELLRVFSTDEFKEEHFTTLGTIWPY
jgi:hypothetical protein